MEKSVLDFYAKKFSNKEALDDTLKKEILDTAIYNIQSLLDMDFGSRLKELRRLAGITGKTMAQKLEIPYSTYMGYENLGREPKQETLAKISKVFGVSIDFLLGKPSNITIDNGHVSFNPKSSPPKKINIHRLTNDIGIAHDITPDVERLKAKLLDSHATFGLKPIDAQTRKALFMRFNQMINDLLYQDYFNDEEPQTGHLETKAPAMDAPKQSPAQPPQADKD